MKKTWVVCGLIFIVFIAFCFLIGYKLPQRDRHKNWTLLSENKDPNYLFRPVFSSNTVLKLGISKTLMLINSDQIAVADSNGNILRKFSKTDVVMIDNFHDRLIIVKPAADNADSKLLNYFSYSLSDHYERPIKLLEYPLVETYNDFAQRNGAKSDDNNGDKIGDYKVDTAIVLKYKMAYYKDLVFFSRLHPVVSIDNDISQPLDVIYYTDDIGKLYNILPLDEKKSQSNEEFRESMNILYPAWEQTPDLNYYHLSNPKFYFADKSSIFGNGVDFNLGLNFSPAGGQDKPMHVSIEQNYLNYYGIKFKNNTVYFKKYSNASDMDIDISDEFIQLNNLKSASDTLAFMCERELYQVYRRQPYKKKR